MPCFQPNRRLQRNRAVVAEETAQHVMIEEPLSIFVGYSHPLAARSNLTQSDLLAFPILKLSAGHPFRKMVDSSLRHAGLAGLRCDVETDDYLEILTMASAGEGLACMFTETGSHDAITHRLAPLGRAAQRRALAS